MRPAKDFIHRRASGGSPRPFALGSLLLALLTTFSLMAPTPLRAESSAYPNADLLVDVDWLSAHPGDADLRIVDMSPATLYSSGHIPGAVNLEWQQIQLVDTSDASIESWRGQVQKTLGGLGISATDTVVVYDEGSLYSARLFWILE